MSENLENQANEIDPWADDAPNDAIPAQAGSDDGFNLDLNTLGEGDEFDDLFDGAELSLEEEDSGEAISYRDRGSVYDNPLDVGIKEGMWVPIRLSEVTFKPKHTPRLSSKVCLAVETDANGKRVVHVPFDKVEKAIKAGATEVVREQELPYFVAGANHVAPEFGQRRWPYEIEASALTIKTAYFKEQRSGKTGYRNEMGASLRKATGATKANDKINLQTMPEIAARMDEQIAMARITISTKEASRPQIDPATNKQITVLADPESGAPIKVVALDQQVAEGEEPKPREYMYSDGSGMMWDGNPQLLVPVKSTDAKSQEYAIRDSGDTSTPLMEKYVKVTDYLDNKAPFLPVPNREVTVEMADEKAGTVEGEITYATVGAIVQGATSGDFVDVLLKTGKKITAVWLGTHWSEVPADGGTAGNMGEFAGVANL